MRDVQSDQSFSLALKCLDDCIRNHPRCPKPDSNAHLPTRVIDCSDPLHPKLFSGQDELNAPYVALSYVWGGPQPNCTTTKNLETYITGFDINLVPKTIQDAIQVTNKLGFRYLWVDSFCIVQDSVEDKKRELIQIRRIFRDAHLTIVASRAESAFAGFLHRCSSPANPPLRLPFWCEDGRLGVVSTKPMPTIKHGTEEPINQRAWCLEERLLSARKLVYKSDTLYYHCQSDSTAVGGSISPVQLTERLSDVMFLPDDEISAHVAEWKPNDWESLQLTWWWTLENYTAREVTKPKDRLTALAGVAEQYDRVWYPIGSDTTVVDEAGIERKYLAGLWKHTIKQDILWHRIGGTLNRSPRPSQYLAPSWSWASLSLEGKFSFSRVQQQFGSDIRKDRSQVKSCEILNCDVELEDERLPHGRVRSGILKLRTKMIPLAWTGGSDASRFGLFVQIVEGRPQDRLLMKVDADASEFCVGWVSIDSIEGLDKEPGLWLSFIMWNESIENIRAAGLLVTDTKDGKFKRIGYWETPQVTDLGDDYKKALLSWYATDSNDTFYIIEIV